MKIFNSLGSNYDFTTALRILFSSGDASAQKKLRVYLESRYGGTATLTYKGREALFLAASSIGEGAIAINGYTCLAVYEAISLSGHAVHYVDTPENALNFTPASLQAAFTENPNIKAVVIQNTLGIPCDIQAIKTLCTRYGAALIEDLAHSIGTRYPSGEEAGTVGDMVILTFSQDKVVDAVSGGALIIRNAKYQPKPVSKKNLAFVQQLKDRLYPLLTWKIRTAYRMGIGKYVHAVLRGIGVLSTPFGKESANCVRTLPGWYCANILQQFAALESTALHRRSIAEVYRMHLHKGVSIPFDIPPSTNLRFPIRTDNRDSLIEFLRTRNVFVSDIWYDAPVAPKKYANRSNYNGQCLHAERISETMLNLPTHINISPEQAKTIAFAINEWLSFENHE